MNETKTDFERLLKQNLWNFLCAQEKLKETIKTPAESYRTLFENLLSFKDIKVVAFNEPISESDPDYWHINYLKDSDWKKRMEESGFHFHNGIAEGKNAHSDTFSFTLTGDKILVSPYLAIQCVGKNIGDLASLIKVYEDPFEFYLRKITDYVPTLDDISKNFLETKDFEKFLLESYKEECIKNDKMYRNLTICPLIESIRQFNKLQGNRILETSTITEILDRDDQILCALSRLRDRYYAHNGYFPDPNIEAEKMQDISILFKNGELNEELVEEVFKKKISMCVGIDAEETLIENLKKQNFPNLTQAEEYRYIKDYITAVNDLYDYIENDLGYDRKDANYLYRSFMGTNIAQVKDKRNEFLHKKIETDEKSILTHDPEIPILFLNNLKMCISLFGRDDVIKHANEFKEKQLELREENEQRTRLRGRLRKASTPKKRQELISQLKTNTPRRQEIATEIRHRLWDNFDSSFVPLKIDKIR